MYINEKHGRDKAKNELVGEGVGSMKQRQVKKAVKKAVANVIDNIDNLDDDTILVGGNMFKKVKKVAKKVGQKTLDSVNIKKGMENNIELAKTINKKTKPAQKAIAKSATDKDGLIHQGISATLDQVPKLLGTAVGSAVTAYTGNPVAGAMAGKATTYGADLGRKELDKRTGYGAVPKGAGKYKKGVDLDKVISKYVPELAGGNQGAKIGVVKPDVGGKKISERNKVVREVMREKGLSLPQASKYVKDNGLWKN